MPIQSLSLDDLLISGVHFGHKVSKWNPKMKPFIFGKHNTIHIIDIKKTVQGLVKAYTFLSNISKRGDTVLFVGTKRQACSVVENEAKRCGMPCVTQRWLGGTLTNHTTIRKRLRRLNEIETLEKDGSAERYTKKEMAGIMREKRRLLRNLGGIRTMERLPSAIVIVDPVHEKVAVDEANKIGAATIALIDTDGNPDPLDIAIPGNDDSMKVIQIVIGKLADAIIEGKAQAVALPAKAKEEVAPVAVASEKK